MLTEQSPVDGIPLPTQLFRKSGLAKIQCILKHIYLVISGEKTWNEASVNLTFLFLPKDVLKLNVIFYERKMSEYQT